MTVVLAGLLKGVLSKLGLVAMMLVERLLHFMALKLIRHLPPIWEALFERAAVGVMLLLVLILIGWALRNFGFLRRSERSETMNRY